MLEVRNVIETVWRPHRRQPRELRRQAGRGARVSRPERLRQIDDRQDARRPDATHERHDPLRRRGHSGSDLLEYKAQVGYVPEEAHVYTYLTGPEYLRLTGRLRGMPEGPLEEKIDRFLRLFGLDTDYHAPLSSYSKGMRQKILLSAALLHNPRVIVLDEPVSGLDVSTALVLRTVVRSLARDGRIIFYSSHELETIEKISTRVMILRAGMVVADDSPPRLRELMHVPSLEDVFAQLAVRENLDEMAGATVETVRCDGRSASASAQPSSAASVARGCASYCRRIGREKRAAYRRTRIGRSRCRASAIPAARIAIVGLAPAAHGANRTGRNFTGDGVGGSGDFLMAALFAERPRQPGHSRAAATTASSSGTRGSPRPCAALRRTTSRRRQNLGLSAAPARRAGRAPQSPRVRRARPNRVRRLLASPWKRKTSAVRSRRPIPNRRRPDRRRGLSSEPAEHEYRQAYAGHAPTGVPKGSEMRRPFGGQRAEGKGQRRGQREEGGGAG